MALRREVTALTPILTDPQNADRTPDDIAAAIIEALDGVRAQTHRIAVIANYAWRPDEEPSLAFIGPFGTRNRSAARTAGEAMAGTTRGGHGKWMIVPAYANAKAAWDAIKPPSKDEQRLAEFLASVRRSTDNPSIWTGLTAPGSAAPCCCGVKPGSWCVQHQKRNP